MKAIENIDLKALRRKKRLILIAFFLFLLINLLKFLIDIEEYTLRPLKGNGKITCVQHILTYIFNFKGFLPLITQRR